MADESAKTPQQLMAERAARREGIELSTETPPANDVPPAKENGGGEENPENKQPESQQFDIKSFAQRYGISAEDEQQFGSSLESLVKEREAYAQKVNFYEEKLQSPLAYAIAEAEANGGNVSALLELHRFDPESSNELDAIVLSQMLEEPGLSPKDIIDEDDNLFYYNMLNGFEGEKLEEALEEIGQTKTWYDRLSRNIKGKARRARTAVAKAKEERFKKPSYEKASAEKQQTAEQQAQALREALGKGLEGLKGRKLTFGEREIGVPMDDDDAQFLQNLQENPDKAIQYVLGEGDPSQIMFAAYLKKVFEKPSKASEAMLKALVDSKNADTLETHLENPRGSKQNSAPKDGKPHWLRNVQWQ